MRKSVCTVQSFVDDVLYGLQRSIGHSIKDPPENVNLDGEHVSLNVTCYEHRPFESPFNISVTLYCHQIRRLARGLQWS